jgi:hypothetical protein
VATRFGDMNAEVASLNPIHSTDVCERSIHFMSS